MASRSGPGTTSRTTVESGVCVVEMSDIFPARARNGGLSPIDSLGRAIWVWRRRFDIVHAFDHRPAVSFPSLVGKARGAILISDWADLWGHGGIAEEREGAGRLLGMLDDFWERRFRQWADGATVITSHLGRRLDAMGMPARRRLLLPPGANIDLIHPLDRAEARRWCGLPVDARIVVFTGFAPYDAELLGEVVWRILEGEPAATVVATGRMPEAMGIALRQRGLAGRLRDLGVVPFADLEKVLACADVLLLPYADKEVNRGRFPNRFGDYLASGRVVVTNRTGDLGDMVEANRIAVLAPEEPEKFAREVVDLLNDPARCEEYAVRARRFAEEVLSWRMLARRVEQFYIEALFPH
ncbi:MAG: glycosyltransferase [Anaerolineales bacterium]|nr:glycosyltransferase [Anaerolineales bacterium]